MLEKNVVVEILKNRKYRVISIIEESDKGLVLKTCNERDKKVYLCKVSRDIRLINREWFMYRYVSSPMLPMVFDFFVEDGFACIIEEFIWGQSLSNFIKKRGNISNEQILDVAKQLALGIIIFQNMQRPVIYRDLKPENIMIAQNGRVRIIDMGSAGFIDEKDILTGTKGYTPPEALSCYGKLGLYTDVFSLGKVMEKMLGSSKANKTIKRIIVNSTEDDPKRRIPNMRYMYSLLDGKKIRGREKIRYVRDVFMTSEERIS